MRTTKVIFPIVGFALLWTVVFLASVAVSRVFREPDPVQSTSYIEFGDTVIESTRELVECEFDEPITVIVSVMHYYDNYEELNIDHLTLTGDDEKVWGWSDCEWQPDNNAAFCDVYTFMPKYVQDDFAMDTIGHEQMHGSCGDFHE